MSRGIAVFLREQASTQSISDTVKCHHGRSTWPQTVMGSLTVVAGASATALLILHVEVCLVP